LQEAGFRISSVFPYGYLPLTGEFILKQDFWAGLEHVGMRLLPDSLARYCILVAEKDIL
jgi:hypothetical protein